MSKPDIYCPACSWRPDNNALWLCTRTGCSTEWNTFWTRGVCPGCAYQWRNTQCLWCGEMSPHESWYHDREPIDGEVVETEKTVEG